MEPFFSSGPNGFSRLLAPSNRPALPNDEPALRALAESMFGLTPKTVRDPVPGHAGYTYFGQLIDHDMTLTDNPLAETDEHTETLVNRHSPFLDLDTLYGTGPAGDSRNLYEHGAWLKLGVRHPSGLLFNFATDPHTGQNLVADPRTLETPMIQQLVVAFAKLHNAAATQIARRERDSEVIFQEARRMTTHQFQYLVWEEWCWKVLDLTILDEARNRNPDGWRQIRWPMFSIPVEFSMAAMRFGHSMVRASYLITGLPAGRDRKIEELVARAGQHGPLEGEWAVRWGAFFGGIPGSNPLPFAKIDTHVVDGLRRIPRIPETLPAMALLRGYRAKLANGPAAAEAFRLEPLMVDDLIPAEPESVRRQGRILEEGGFLESPPLWYYLLRESGVRNEGVRLGPLGSRIVLETIDEALAADPHSYRNTPGWSLPVWEKWPTGTINTIGKLLRFSDSL